MPSLLVPVSVVAKIVKTKTAVPSLSGAPFNTDLSLEAGIHVHWALPDALTNAKALNPGTANEQLIFPAVPSLWLVTRFNPPVANTVARTWTAWVVDSRAKTVTPYAHWAPPAAPDPKTVHTLPGLLPVCATMPGWGVWDNSQTDFDAAITSQIYYPTCRSRFGFYDDLSGLPASGNFSYTVVGWYPTTGEDPLYEASDREKQIAAWQFSYDHHRAVIDILTPVAAQTPAASWKPVLTSSQQIQTRAATVQAKPALDIATARSSSMLAISAALGKTAATPILPIYTTNQPGQLVCHGSVQDVPLNGAPGAGSIAASQIAVYPSLKRALAAVTAPTVTAQQLDYAEMLLQDLDHQKGTMGGVIDLPGAAQALTFQNIPGPSTYYAQIEISIFSLPMRAATLAQFVVDTATVSTASGHWPTDFAMQSLSMTSASAANASRLAGQISTAPPPMEAAPAQPTPAAIATWLANVAAAFQKTSTDAAAAGTPIDPVMIRVNDTRSNAQPLNLGPNINGSTTDGGGYWVRADDTDSLTQILIATTGASVSLPSVTNLYVQPGPRWYRPWSPQIVLTQAQNASQPMRSYRFGEDGRFDPKNGTLKCRTSGYTAYAISANTGALVQGSSLMANASQITSQAALPPDTASLLYEAVMLDTGSAPALAAAVPVAQRAASQTYFTTAIQGVYLQRVATLSQAAKDALGKIKVMGTQPSPVALTPWQDPYDPLYLDANYSLLHSSLETDWQLLEDNVEMTPANAAALTPPAGQEEIINERSRVTASITKVLESALVTRTTLNPDGISVRRQDAPNGLTADVFQTMDLLSAPLSQFDATLFNRGYRERAGTLRVNKVSLVDVFGIARQWTGGAGTGPSTPLAPRLPFWSRLSFRLQAAANLNQEANASNPAICGILLPDFLDHSLQVFDGSGNGIGQITTDRPRYGLGATDPGATLNVQFTAYPWVSATGDPLNAIADPTLRQLVAGIAVQSLVIPPKADGTAWFESGLTAMLRTIDTVRATLDPTYNTPDRKVSLMGEPILVMVARLRLDGTAVTDPKQVTAGSPPLTAPPALPTIPVRIGDITRPDDGVLGFFTPNDSPANSRYSPVSKDAADKAIFNGLNTGAVFNNPNGLAVTHPFVLNQINEMQLPAATTKDVIMLTDIRGDIYATAGVLPRKSITVPKDFLDAALQNMEPVFAVGPIFTVSSTAGVKPLFPPPQVQGYDADFVYSAPGAATPFPDTLMPPSTPIGDLPPTRVVLNEGWVKLKRRKTGS